MLPNNLPNIIMIINIVYHVLMPMTTNAVVTLAEMTAMMSRVVLLVMLLMYVEMMSELYLAESLSARPSREAPPPQPQSRIPDHMATAG